MIHFKHIFEKFIKIITSLIKNRYFHVLWSNLKSKEMIKITQKYCFKNALFKNWDCANSKCLFKIVRYSVYRLLNCPRPRFVSLYDQMITLRFPIMRIWITNLLLTCSTEWIAAISAVLVVVHRVHCILSRWPWQMKEFSN